LLFFCFFFLDFALIPFFFFFAIRIITSKQRLSCHIPLGRMGKRSSFLCEVALVSEGNVTGSFPGAKKSRAEYKYIDKYL
jgi:hypothetical protein